MKSHTSACAVIDTNVVLDCCVFDDAAVRPLVVALRTGGLRWLATPRMLDELQEVLNRPLPPRWENARQQALHDRFGARAQLATAPPGGRLRCRDADDQMFIDLALAHPGCTLLTRDRALLVLAKPAAALGVTVTHPARWALPSDA